MKLVDKLVKANIMEKATSTSSFNTPHVIIPKKQVGRYRMIGQFAGLNRATIRIPMYPMSRMDDTMRSLQEMTILGSSDVHDGYYQVGIKKEDRHKTDLRLHGHGQFLYVRMPQGWSGAPATFNYLMNQVLRWCQLLYVDDVLVSVLVFYMDDIFVANKTTKAHIYHWFMIFGAMTHMLICVLILLRLTFSKRY
jgi:hypothetical protein